MKHTSLPRSRRSASPSKKHARCRRIVSGGFHSSGLRPFIARLFYIYSSTYFLFISPCTQHRKCLECSLLIKHWTQSSASWLRPRVFLPATLKLPFGRVAMEFAVVAEHLLKYCYGTGVPKAFHSIIAQPGQITARIPYRFAYQTMSKFEISKPLPFGLNQQAMIGTQTIGS